MGSKEDSILIAVLGVTGAGKTTFINKATGSSLTVGHSITSCKISRQLRWKTLICCTGTKDIAYADTYIDGKYVRLIDTPGFDDTERTDADVLEDIAKWLEATYRAGILLTGIILLQPISNNKVYGSEARRTRLFKKICGPNSFGNVVIATTMWSEMQNTNVGEQRVQERKGSTDFWGDMVKFGAQVEKHHDNKQSTHRIIRLLLNKRKTQLQMQTELAQNDGMLHSTSAAQQLYSDLGAASAKENNRLQELTRELQSAREERKELMQELRELRQKVIDLERQRDKLESVRVSHILSSPHSNAEWLNHAVGLFGRWRQYGSLVDGSCCCGKRSGCYSPSVLCNDLSTPSNKATC